MKKLLLSAFFAFFLTSLFAQKVDSIYFHLYTDSLKKGQHNYINVDGKLTNGRWMPLTSKEIQFSCNAAVFNGNELIIPPDFTEEKVTVKAVLKNNPAIWIERTIWIKKLPDGPLPTRNDVLPSTSPANKKKKRN
jgi:hypothetical protein